MFGRGIRKMSQGNDLISRDKAIELVTRICNDILTICKSHYDEDLGEEVYDDIKEINAVLKCNKDIRTALRELPAEPRWIPCSERKLLNGSKVLATIKTDDGYTFTGNVVTSEYTTPYCLETGPMLTSKVVAWMPLPSPFKDDEDGV